MSRSNVLMNSRLLPGVICLVFALTLLAAPAAATATTWVNVTRYADNNYSTVVDWSNMTYTDMKNNFTNVYSNGDLYMQQGTFNASDKYGDAGQGMIRFYGHNGTYVRNLTDEVDGMDEGDEVKIVGNDGFKMYFGEDDIYSPEAAQPSLVVTWWDSEMGYVPDFSYGMRLYFYDPNPAATYSNADCLNFTLREMCNNFDPWYQRWVGDWMGTGSYPNTKGLSVKNVQYLKVYPPHRHDFNTTGDTTEYAFKYQVGASPGAGDPSTPFTSAELARIADIDANYVESTADDTNYAAHRFNFTIDTDSALDGPLTDIENLNVTWHGRGLNDGGDGATLYIYNFTAGSYRELDSNTFDYFDYLAGDIVGTLAADGTMSGISDYVNAGNVTVLVKQNSPTSDDDGYYSNIQTDYVKLTVTHHHWNS
ncbi:MAG: hypothetical protein PWP08_639 [Methanofollis sp.]|nr:hypothetical protein [Methanofollis sp.]